MLDHITSNRYIGPRQHYNTKEANANPIQVPVL